MEFQKLKFEDLEFVYIVRKQSAEYLHDPTIYSYEEVINWFNRVSKDPSVVWYIIIHEGQKIGYIRTNLLKYNRLFIGMDLHEDYRGKGTGQLAYKEFINYLYKVLPLNDLWLKVLKTNTRAIHIYEKLGFKKIEEEIIDRANRKEESITYKLTKNTWYDIQSKMTG